MTQDAPDIGKKAHIEHPIGFVQDQVLEPAELCVRGPKMIQQPARGADNHVNAAPKRVLLRSHPDAAEHGRRGQRRMHREIVQVLHDLRRQLTRRRQHERPRRSARFVDETMEDRQKKGRGLAAAGHRACQQVVSGHGEWNGVGLNGRRPGESEVFEALEEIGVEPEMSKRHGSL